MKLSIVPCPPSILVAASMVFCGLLLPGPASALPSCGLLAAPACAGPMDVGTTSADIWSFTGVGCGAGCVAAMTGDAVAVMIGANQIRATWGTGLGLPGLTNVNCGGRGSCTINHSNGLPVELLSFGVE